MVLAGGGGVSGTGIPSGFLVGRIPKEAVREVRNYFGDGGIKDYAWNESWYSLVDTNDVLVYAIVPKPLKEDEPEIAPVFAAALGDYISCRAWNMERKSLDEVGKFRADFHKDDPLVMGLAFSKDGKLFATGGEDKQIRIWRWPDDIYKTPKDDIGNWQMQLHRKYSGHASAIRCVAFNADGSLLASASLEDRCYVWTVEHEKLLWKISSNSSNGIPLKFRGCRFHISDPRILYTWMNESPRGPGYLAKWDLNSWSIQRIKRICNDAISQGELSHDGKMIAIGSQSGVTHVIRLEDFSIINSTKIHEFPTTGLAFSPCSRRLLSVAGDRSFRIFQINKKSSGVKFLLIVGLSFILLTIIVFIAGILINNPPPPTLPLTFAGILRHIVQALNEQ